MKQSRKTILAIVGLCIVLVVAVGARLILWAGSEHQQPLASIGGAFELVDGDGKKFTEQDLKGKWSLVFFGYTFCPDVCPTSLSIVAQVMDKLPPETAQQLVPVFISIDPERDTPEVVKAYVAAFHDRMVGLTGTPEQVNQAAKAFKVYAAKAKGSEGKDYLMDHTSMLYLMTPDFTFARHFSHGTTADGMVDVLQTEMK